MSTSPTRRTALCAALVAAACCGGLRAQMEPSLWVSDDVNLTIYHVSLDGTVLGSFHSGSVSGLAQGIGMRRETLWAVKEGSNLVVHFDANGKTLSSFKGTVYDPDAKAPEGIAVDPIDWSLWIVDDATQRVYNVTQDGTPISSFPTGAYDPAADSPQAIAIDPADGTLWITDNGTDRVYHVTRDGQVLSSFHVDAFEPQAKNLQGIGLDPDGRALWVTDRATQSIYHVSRIGEPISVLDASTFGSSNPSGVAFDAPLVPSLPGLLVELNQGVDGGQIAPELADRIGQLVETAAALVKSGETHVAAKQLVVFHAVVDELDGTQIDAALAATLLEGSKALIESVLNG